MSCLKNTQHNDPGLQCSNTWTARSGAQQNIYHIQSNFSLTISVSRFPRVRMREPVLIELFSTDCLNSLQFKNIACFRIDFQCNLTFLAFFLLMPAESELDIYQQLAQSCADRCR